MLPWIIAGAAVVVATAIAASDDDQAEEYDFSRENRKMRKKAVKRARHAEILKQLEDPVRLFEARWTSGEPMAIAGKPKNVRRHFKAAYKEYEPPAVQDMKEEIRRHMAICSELDEMARQLAADLEQRPGTKQDGTKQDALAIAAPITVSALGAVAAVTRQV